MNIEIKNLDNLTEKEKETFSRLVEKSNKKSKVFKPAYRQGYFYIDTVRDVGSQKWDDDGYDNACYELGNCFETRKQAEFAIEKQKVYMELKRYALEHNEGVIDWFNSEQIKFSITGAYLTGYKVKLRVLPSKGLRDLNSIYFTSEEIAKNAIKEIGEDRIKKRI